MAKNNIPKKAAALAAIEANLKPAGQVAKAAKVSRATIYNWKREASESPELTAAVQAKREQLAAKMEKLAGGIADKLLSDLDSVTWDNKAGTVLGIVTDKWLALTGQAQSITETRVSGAVNITVEARRALELYTAEGFTAEEARGLLAEDDPELYRALLSAEHGAGPVIDADPAE